MITDTYVLQRNQALLHWYESSSRRLPWRDTGDPYVTLVSEAMLQQTQVSRVIDRFGAFIEIWPTVGELAEAPTSNLLAAWSGLGYNSRALRLRAAARMIDADGWPDTPAGLRRLPGVGPYTANAIASIAFGEEVPAVDTNLKRVLSRWLGEQLSGTNLDTAAHEALGFPAGTWNQAVMDLGATICRPRNPRCDECPVTRWCTDPAVYEPPPRQAPFKGSRRELRGALVRASINGEDPYEIGRSIGRSDMEIEETIAALSTEGLLENPGNR